MIIDISRPLNEEYEQKFSGLSYTKKKESNFAELLGTSLFNARVADCRAEGFMESRVSISANAGAGKPSKISATRLPKGF